MNIKNRLKKLEGKKNNASVNCECRDVRKLETYMQDLSEKAETNEPKLTGKPVPDICLFCRKPIEKDILTIQLVDHSTKERFPEHWQAK